MTRIHLDTSYLMPLFGIDTSIASLNSQLLEILVEKNLIFCYSPVSVIEIKWQVIKLGKSGYDRNSLEMQFSQALTSLRFDERFVRVDFTDSRINDISYELMKMGHEDYFDTVIASSALLEADVFITEDRNLRELIVKYAQLEKDFGLKKLEVVSWREFYNNKVK